tara:strand:+ start:400 stop:600 length:201 start_codon:yes stop_codon:yes gene_type:complete
MRKNLGLYAFLVLAFLALFISRQSYKNFSLEKSINSCVISQMKKSKNMTSTEARLFCESEIKVKKN